jgi:hypothetical protein
MTPSASSALQLAVESAILAASFRAYGRLTGFGRVTKLSPAVCIKSIAPTGERVKVLRGGFACSLGPSVRSLRDSKQVAFMDNRLKGLMKELGEAINSSLSDSDEIAEVISRIKAGGYDVFLVLEATIGLNQRDGDAVERSPIKTPRSSGDFRITSQDMKFLKSLRIRVDDGK